MKLQRTTQHKNCTQMYVFTVSKKLKQLQENIFISRTSLSCFAHSLLRGDQSTRLFWWILWQVLVPDPDHHQLHLEVRAEKYCHEEYFTLIKWRQRKTNSFWLQDISSCVMEIMVWSLSLSVPGHNPVSWVIWEGIIWCKGWEVATPGLRCQLTQYNRELGGYMCHLLRCWQRQCRHPGRPAYNSLHTSQFNTRLLLEARILSNILQVSYQEYRGIFSLFLHSHKNSCWNFWKNT